MKAFLALALLTLFVAPAHAQETAFVRVANADVMAPLLKPQIGNTLYPDTPYGTIGPYVEAPPGILPYRHHAEVSTFAVEAGEAYTLVAIRDGFAFEVNDSDHYAEIRHRAARHDLISPFDPPAAWATIFVYDTGLPQNYSLQDLGGKDLLGLWLVPESSIDFNDEDAKISLTSYATAMTPTNSPLSFHLGRSRIRFLPPVPIENRKAYSLFLTGSAAYPVVWLAPMDFPAGAR